MDQFIPFGEWLPDLPIFNNAGATVAKNVIPESNGYLRFPSPAIYSTSIGGTCKGAIVARDLTGVYVNYAGDSSALYQLTSLSWSNVSRTVGGAYNSPTEDYWEFVQFGNRVFGVNGAAGDAPQAISIGTAHFAALGGGSPAAGHIAAVRDFIVLGNISATATSPQMVRWCGINNPDSWTPDAATLADFQELPGDGGWVQKIVGGEYGTVFQERAVYRMTFVGSPLIFQFDKVQLGIGAFAPQAVASYRNFSFFLSEDGFYMFDGTSVTPIGVGKVDATFLNDVDINYTYRIHALVDPKRKIVLWAYPSVGAGGIPNRIMIYSWVYRKWSRIEDVSLDMLARVMTGTYTLEGLDAVSGNLDTLVASLDATQWKTGNTLLGAFNSNHRLTLFNGSAMAAVVETGDSNPFGDKLAYVNEVRPYAEGLSASISIAVATRNTLTESAPYATARTPNSAGFAEVRSVGRFLRFKMTTSSTSDFDHLLGVYINPTLDATR